MEKHFGHYKWKEKPCRRGWNPGEIDWLIDWADDAVDGREPHLIYAPVRSQTKPTGVARKCVQWEAAGRPSESESESEKFVPESSQLQLLDDG